MATEQKQDWIQRVPSNLTNFFLCNLCESEGCTPLQVDIVGEGECCQRSQRRAREEVGRRPICKTGISRRSATEKLASTHSPNIARGLRPLHVRSPGVMARMIATCALELRM